MKIDRNEPPRAFRVGRDEHIEIRHAADVELDPDEQITFVTRSGTEFDVVRKDWGYYATPSLNGRLSEHDLRAVLVRNSDTGRLYVLLVERGHEAAFQAYVDDDGLTVVCWLDDDEAVESAVRRLAGS